MEKQDIIKRVNSINLEDIERSVTEYERFTKVVKFVSSSLPAGYLRRIEAIIGPKYSRSYINQFFNLKYNLTKENIIILETAIEIILEDINAWEKTKSKIFKVLGNAN